jgi:sialic acid synthase SpsE
LIGYTAKKGKPMIVSTGMGSLDEIEDAVNAMLDGGLSKEQITLLVCTSEYPALISDMNLLTIADLHARFGVSVGFSDHSMGILAPVVATSLGAKVIEKHFCLSRKIKTPDSDFSSEPLEFAEMVKAVQEAAKARGQVFYGPTEREKSNVIFRRSIFSVKDIQAGEPFTSENIRIIRPGYGIKPKYYSRLIGKSSKKNYSYGEPINDEALNE